MEANVNKLKTKIHKPGISRNCAANVSYSQENGRRIVSFTRRDSSLELGLNSLPGLLSRREQRTTVEPGLTETFSSNNLFSEVPSYNLWRSRADRRRSLPSCFTSPERKTSTSSGIFVPSVITPESKGLRKYSTSLRGTSAEYQDETTTHTRAVNHDRHADSANNNNVVPSGRSCKQTNNREHPGVCYSPSLQFDSVSTMRCSSTDTSLARRDETRSYYAKNDRIKRWLSQVEEVPST